ncbi:putative E3 ubiquitin-protein ligase UBR7 [Bienertia sinuspersici]
MDDVFEDEGEKQTYTLNEYLDDLEEREMEAEMVLGGDDGDECTYSKGYLKRQAIFSCLTCTPEGNAGFCTACSLSCHEAHEIPVDEEGEAIYEDLICPGCSEASSFLTFYPQSIFVAPKKHEVVANDEKGKGKLEEAPSTCATADKIMDTTSDPSKLSDVADIKAEYVSCKEGLSSAEIPEKVLGLNKCSEDGSSGTPCQLGIDLGVAPPPVERKKAIFLAKNWRDSLCRCEKCSTFYKQKKVGFLLDKEDSIAEYEKRAQHLREERLQKQEGASLNMFNNLGHVEKVEIMSGIAEMKSAMENFFANRDTSEAVTSADVYQLFDNLTKKRRREM